MTARPHRLLWALLAATAACGGGQEEPPPIYDPERDSTGSESAPDQETGSSSQGLSEGEAVMLAIEAAAAEGHDAEAYSDIVVHRRGDHWEVQLRKPRILRFLLVTVHSETRHTEVQVRTHQ